MNLSMGRITSYGIFFLLLFLPLIFFIPVFNPYEYPKFLFFVITIQVLLLFNIFRSLIYRKYPFKIDFSSGLLIGFAIVVLASDIFGLDFKTSILGSDFRRQGFLTLETSILFFLLIKSSKNFKDYFLYKKAILIGVFFVSMFAVYQIISFYLFKDLSIPRYNGRIVGTLGNPNFLGGYLAIALPFLFEIKNSSVKNYILKLIFIAIVIVVIMFSFSRSAIIASLIILIIYFVKSFLNKERFFGALIIISATIFFLVSRQDQVFFNLNKLRQISVWDNQLIIWNEGIKAVINRPILGYGQENLELVYPPKRFQKVDNAHNIFLEIAVSSGLTGLLAFLAIIFYFFRKSNSTIKISLVAFLIVAQFNPLSIAEIAFFWFLLASGKRH